MKIDSELIKKLEKLSNIELNEKEEEKIKGDLNDLLAYLEILDNVNVDGIDELISPAEFSSSVLRKDEVETFDNRESIINNFPENKDGFLKVPGINIKEEEWKIESERSNIWRYSYLLFFKRRIQNNI